MKTPTFRKPDRYKLSSYHAFNTQLLNSYDSCFWLRVFQAIRWDETIVSELKPDLESLRILDVGCATGRLLLSLAQAGAQHLSGFDLAPGMIQRAGGKLRSHGFRAHLKSGDAEDRIPWPDDTFDAATLVGVLHHFFRPNDALREIRRVLGRSGRILIIEPSFPPLVRQLINLVLRFFPHHGDCRFYSPGAVARMLERNAYTDVRYRRLGWHSFMVSGIGNGS